MKEGPTKTLEFPQVLATDYSGNLFHKYPEAMGFG
jgi:hypothetical protein